MEDWLAAKEAFLNNDDLGENLDGEPWQIYYLFFFLYISTVPLGYPSAPEIPKHTQNPRINAHITANFCTT